MKEKQKKKSLLRKWMHLKENKWSTNEIMQKIFSQEEDGKYLTENENVLSFFKTLQKILNSEFKFMDLMFKIKLRGF